MVISVELLEWCIMNTLGLFRLSFEDGSTETCFGQGLSDAFWMFADTFGLDDLDNLLSLERTHTFE
jgi:hypothetical protein